MTSSDSSSSNNRQSNSSSDVWLHVYDVGPVASTLINSWSRLFQFGVFHAGIEVFGEEYTFQAMLTHLDEHGKPKTGVIKHEPKQRPSMVFRESVALGQTLLSSAEVDKQLSLLARDWCSSSYDVLSRNCVHFSEQLAKELQTTEPFPSWVNDLARSLSPGASRSLSVPSCFQSSASRAEERIVAKATESEVLLVSDPMCDAYDVEIHIGAPLPKDDTKSNGLLDMRKARFGGC